MSVCSSMFITLSITLTASQLITERKEGVIDRTWVAGVCACMYVCLCACVCLMPVNFPSLMPSFA